MFSRNKLVRSGVLWSLLLLPSLSVAADLEGRIFYDSSPQSYATVTLINGGDTVATAVTDPDGNYTFEDLTPGIYRMRVQNDEVNNAQSKVELGAENKIHNIWLISEVDIPVEQNFVLTGTVSDLNSRVYSNVEIEFQNTEDYTRRYAYTDENGHYEVELQEGTYGVSYHVNQNIDLDGDGVTEQYISFSDRGHTILVDADKASPVQLPLKQAEVNAVHNGVEVDAVARLDYFRNEYDNEIDDFRYTYFYNYHRNVADAPVIVYAGAEHQASLVPNDDEDLLFATEISDFVTSPGPENDIINQEITDTGFVVSVSVVDDDQLPLNGGCVRYTSLNSNLFIDECAPSDTNIVEVNVPEGDYSIDSSNYGDADWLSSIEGYYPNVYFGGLDQTSYILSEDSVEYIDYTLSLPIYRQLGRVVNENGEGIQGATVLPESDYYYIDGEHGQILVQTYDLATLSAANGNFAIYIPNGLRLAEVTPPSDSQYKSRYVDFAEADKDSRFYITLTEEEVVDPPEPGDGYPVTGKVLNLNGGGVEMKVELYDDSYALIDTTISDSNGNYSLSAASVGNYSIRVSYKEYWSSGLGAYSNSLNVSTRDFTLQDEYHTEITLPILNATFHAYDIKGNPIPGISFTVSGNAPYDLGIDYAYGSQTGNTNAGGTVSIPVMYGHDEVSIDGHSLPINVSSYYSQPKMNNSHTDVIYLGEVSLNDRDNDGISDFYEDWYGDLDPGQDFDNDGVLASEEYLNMSSPHDSDSDKDGLSDAEDDNSQMPLGLTIDSNVDSDNDGWSDVAEKLLGTDHTDSSSYPRLISEMNFSDPQLANCVANSGGGIEYAQELTSLYCYNLDVENLDDLQYFTSLTNLTLAGGNLGDISVLQNFLKLEHLSLWDATFENLESIAPLTNLRTLEVNFTGIVDLSFLAGFENLELLWLAGGEVVSLDFVSSLKSLKRLSLQNMDGLADEVFKLQALTQLEELNFGSSQLSDLSWITSLTSLTNFEIWGQTGVDFTPLGQLLSLKHLWLGNSNIDDISFLEGLNLITLGLYDNNISDLSPLEGMATLLSIYLAGNPNLTCIDEYFYTDYSYEELVELCPFDSVDTDNDGIPDSVDNDDDNDGIPDSEDTQPLRFDATLLNAIYIPNNWSDNQGLVAYVRDMGDETNVVVDMYDNVGGEFVRTIEWPRTYSNAEVFVVDDINQNGYPDIGLFGFIDTVLDGGAIERKAQFFVKDSFSGETIRAYNWPTNWTEMSLVLLDDVNSDGIKDFGLQGRFYVESRPQLVVKDAASGSTITTFSYPDLLEAPVYHQLSDMNGDGLGEIGLFGRIKANNKIQIKVSDGVDPDNRLPAYNFPDKWEQVSWHKLFDINFDGQTDYGMFGVSKEDGRVQLFTKDGTDRVGTLGIFGWPEDLVNPILVQVPDMTFDGVPELAVFGYRSSADRYQLIVKDGTDRDTTLVNHGWRNNLDDVSVHVLGDLNYDGIAEVAILGKRASGAWELNINDGADSQTLMVEVLGLDWSSKPKILVTPDGADSTVNVYGNSDSGNEIMMSLAL